MELLPLGDSALLLRLGETLDADTLARVRAVAAALERAGLAGVREVVPAMASLVVTYDPLGVPAGEGSPHERLCRAVRAHVLGAELPEPAPGALHTLPVCYGGACGPDLEVVAAHAGLSPDEVVRRHAGAEYTVAMIGFAPGFPYLLGLPPELATPRRARPRTSVPAGSVGIAGVQTGLYPQENPGGWQLIGRTPRRLFRADAARPALLQPGDRVRFHPIPHEALATWEEPSWR